MGESRAVVAELLSLCLQRISLEQSAMNTELEFLEVVKSFEVMRRRCCAAESELKKYKELLVKSDVAKAALDVKLKHVRNQLDLEMQKRLRVERDFQYLQRQMQLMCDILVQDSKSSTCLNDEQKSLLATFEHKAQSSNVHRTSKRLSVIDESSFLSDISYDKTDDDVDLNTTVIRPLKSRARERRRSSMGVVSANGTMGKRLRANISTEIESQVLTRGQDRICIEKEVETILKASILTPESSQIHMVVGFTQEKQDLNRETRPEQDLAPADADQTSVWCPTEETLEPETETQTEDFFRTNSGSSTFSNICHRTPNVSSQPPSSIEHNRGNNTSAGKHVFISKTVIRPELCSCCGKRMRFGKAVVKCRNCRVVVHPECKSKCPVGCSSTAPPTPGSQAKHGPQVKPGSLESFCPMERPRVPPLVVDCISEIERRGLQERGLYRVPGGDRALKELRERFLAGKTALSLGKVEDVHVVCGLLKDFLRKLPEPLVTFRLHPRFMEAAEIEGETGTVIIYKAISDLPPANKDTLAFILLHLHKVMLSAECHMDHSNLCRIFGPTLIGHGLAEPCPTTIMRDTAAQHKVMSRLLSIPVDYWKRVLCQTEQSPTSAPPSVSGTSSGVRMTNQDEGPCRLFKPVTSPELSAYNNRQGSITKRLRNLGNAGNMGRGDLSRRFFPTPN